MTVMDPGVTRAAPTQWTWERTLPITESAAVAPAGRGLRVFPALTWWTAAMITLMFVILVVVV